MSYISNIQREISLRFLAQTASGNETFAYILLNNGDKDTAKEMMDSANDIKRYIRENTVGIEQKLYLELAEGHYTPPKKVAG